jgi:hypothetical protein
MESINNIIEKASLNDIWLIHDLVVKRLRQNDTDSASTSASTSSSTKRKGRKLIDLVPLFESGKLTSPEPCYIKTNDNVVNANLIFSDNKIHFAMDNGTIFKNPSGFTSFHSEQITPNHPRPTKPCDGWSYIKLKKNGQSIGQILSETTTTTTTTESTNTVIVKKKMTDEQKTSASVRSRKWAEEAHAILAKMRLENPAATYNDAQKELKKQKTTSRSVSVEQSDNESVVEEAVKPKYIDSVVFKFISRLETDELDECSALLIEKFDMTLEEANDMLDRYLNWT